MAATAGRRCAVGRSIPNPGRRGETASGGLRRVITATAAAALLAVLLNLHPPSTPAAAAAPDAGVPYSDIKDDPAGHHIHLLTAKGIIDGFPDGTFRPAEPLTRAQFAKLLVSSMELPLPGTSAPSPFTDVAAGHWAAPFIGAAWEHGLIEGVGGGLFSPEGTLTRAELAVLLDRALQRTAAPGGEAAPAPPAAGRNWGDAGHVPEWAWPAAIRMAALGIMPDEEGADGVFFRPLDRALRGETAEALARFLSHAAMAYDLLGTVEAAEADSFTVAFQGSTGRRRFTPGGSTAAWLNGRPISPTALEPLDEVGLVLNGGQVQFVSAWFLDDIGVVQTVSTPSRTIVYRGADGSTKQGVLKVGAGIYRNGRPALLQSLRPGDSIYLLFSVFDGNIRTVDAVDISLRGNIHTLRLHDGTLRILKGPGDSRTITVAPSAAIFLDGSRAGLDELRVGDLVYGASDESGRFIYLEVYRLARDPRRT